MKHFERTIAAAQGMWMRRTLKMAPPAPGPTRGSVGPAAGRLLRVAVVGDSTAAGCGVQSHEDGFVGNLAREIAARTGRPVQWQAVGQFGATARRIRYRLLPQLGEDLNVVVLLAGGNDVMAGRTPDQWGGDLTAIVDDLSQRADEVIVVGLPPFALFPSIPETLGRQLAARAAALDDVSRRVCARGRSTVWVTTTEPPTPGFFALDRFHPSALGYHRWAHVVAGHVLVSKTPTARPGSTP